MVDLREFADVVRRHRRVAIQKAKDPQERRGGARFQEPGLTGCNLGLLLGGPVGFRPIEEFLVQGSLLSRSGLYYGSLGRRKADGIRWDLMLGFL